MVQSKGPTVNVVVWVGAGLATVFVAARLFTRLHLTRCPGWDDWVLVVAAVLIIITASLSSVAVSYGLGRHLNTLSVYDGQQALFYSMILQPSAIFAFVLPKLAVIILLDRLMGPKKQGQIILYSSFGVLFVLGSMCALILFAQCNPPTHAWRPWEPAECIDPSVLYIVTVTAGAWSAFVDLVLALFPISLFWNLQIPRIRKIWVSVLMGLGIFAMVCAIIKVTHLHVEQDPDFTWAFPELIIWTTIEGNVVIVCACIPVLPPLLALILGRDILGSSGQMRGTWKNDTSTEEQGQRGVGGTRFERIRSRSDVGGRGGATGMTPTGELAELP